MSRGYYTRADYLAADRATRGVQFSDYPGELENARRYRWYSLPVNRDLRKDRDYEYIIDDEVPF